MHDDDTAISRQILKILGTNHPVRVGLGFCGATLVKIGVKIGTQYYDYAWLRVLDETPTWQIWIVIAGLLILPIVFGKGIAPEDVQTQINTVQALIDAAKLPKARAALVWNGLIEKYIRSMEVDLQKPKKIDLIAEAQNEIAENKKVE
jgi:hypothetical protein